ncbi:MAG: hypothetical protein K8R18_02275 [Parvibaculum sp.]|uniref:hypothetical protein n=1 Tax=Parvibaculum sp. TaxID=2024848 RepID=UPI0025D33F07|nr:hypothetical protein [Parvibaculum sp.]MCE9648427.1 hypothetical protein [Parvibaculum sp.]
MAARLIGPTSMLLSADASAAFGAPSDAGWMMALLATKIAKPISPAIFSAELIANRFLLAAIGGKRKGTPYLSNARRLRERRLGVAMMRVTDRSSTRGGMPYLSRQYCSFDLGCMGSHSCTIGSLKPVIPTTPRLTETYREKIGDLSTVCAAEKHNGGESETALSEAKPRRILDTI